MTSASTSQMKMKELEARSGVGREAIRFYIREGMLPEPERPKRNVAFYSDEHLNRLKAIRHLQDERELSLARIKTVLASPAFESLTSATSLQGLERLLPAMLNGVVPVPERRRADVLADGDVTEQELVELIESGIVTPTERDDDTWIDFRDAAIIKNWGAIRSAGFTPERGYNLATLRRYHDAVEHLAAAEVDEFLDAFAGEIDTQTAAEVAMAGIASANEILLQLHTKAIMQALTDRLTAPGADAAKPSS